MAREQRVTPGPYESPLRGLSQRMPPSNTQAEMSLLGAILANNKAFHMVAGYLRPEHFALAENGLIFREAARLILRGQLADGVTLKTVLENSGALDEVGGTAYLASLLSAMVGIVNAGEYGRAIHESWLRRQLIDTGAAIVENAFSEVDAGLDGEAQLSAAIDQLMNLTAATSRDAPDVSAGDAARLAIQTAENLLRGGGSGLLKSGVNAVDRVVGPLMPGWFYVLAGRPGMGKTSLSTQIAVSVARQLRREVLEAEPFSAAGGDVVFFSLEMPKEQIAGWMACQMAGVSNDILGVRLATIAEAPKILQAEQELDELPLRVIDAVGMSGPAMALRARAMNARRRVRLVLVDHVQKVVSSRSGEKDGDLTATQKTTSALKDLSRQLGCPVIALAQLKRDVDQREDPRPRLSDLLYAGEQDADVAMFLFRQERYLKRRPPDKFPRESDEQHAKRVHAWHQDWDGARDRAELIVAKRRQGPEGAATLAFDGPTTTFSDIGSEHGGDGPLQGNWWDDPA